MKTKSRDENKKVLIDFYFQSRATSKKLDNKIKQSSQQQKKPQQ